MRQQRQRTLTESLLYVKHWSKKKGIGLNILAALTHSIVQQSYEAGTVANFFLTDEKIDHREVKKLTLERQDCECRPGNSRFQGFTAESEVAGSLC